MASGQTIIKYGSRGDNVLEIHNVHTIRCDQESVFDDTGTNMIGTRFVVTARGLVHNPTSLLQPRTEPVPSGADATEIARTIRVFAMRQRQRFEMIVGADPNGNGGQTFLACNPAIGSSDISNVDVENGPRCLNLEVEHVNAQVYRVAFTFSMLKAPECAPDGSNPNQSGILSITFSVTDEVNQDFITTRNWEGQVRSMSALVNPHSFRNFALPVLQLGMRRDKMTFNASPDGLLLNFQITDRETYCSPPPPATSWAGGGLKTVISTGTGKIAYVDVSCGLAGDRFADRKKLLELCVAIVESRMYSYEGDRLSTNIKTTLDTFAVSETIDNDSAYVFVSVRGERSVVGTTVNTIIDSVIGTDPQKQTLLLGGQSNPTNERPVGSTIPEIREWDTRRHRGNWVKASGGATGDKRGNVPESEGAISVTTALSTHLQSECTSSRSVKSGPLALRLQGSGSGSGSGSQKPQIQEYVSDIVEQPPRTNRVSREHLRAPYTVWKMESRYEIDDHRVPMPIARTSSGSISQDLPSVALISLCPSTATMTVRCFAVRIGKAPDMPEGKNFVDSNTGIVYTRIDFKILPRTKDQRAGGDDEFVVDVEILYSLSRAPRPNERLLIGRNPWDTIGIQRTPLNVTQNNPQGNFFA